MYAVKDFNAAGDGKTKDTAAIQKAIDKCASDWGGRVIVAPGVYLCGTLWLRSNVELHLEPGAEILGSPELADYEDFKSPGFRHEQAPEKSSKCLICASGASNVAISGPGRVNGSGPFFYDTSDSQWGFYKKPASPRPRMIIFHNCENVRFEDASFLDSPCWTFWLIACRNVVVRNIRVVGDQRMINNDGIDIDSCQGVVVSGCQMKTGDDCVVLRAIDGVLDSPEPCENVTVSDCVLDSRCQAIRIGCPSDGVIRDCVFSNMTLKSRFGINIDNPKRYLRPGHSGSLDLSNILFSNFVAACDKSPVRVWVEEGVKLRRVSGIRFSNFRLAGGAPCIVEGNADTVFEDVSFSDGSMACSGESALLCRNCRSLKLDNVELSNSEKPQAK